MTSYATLEKPVTPDNERLHGVPHRTDTSRSLALMDEPTALTPRELEALHWTMEGKTAWEVGAVLGITLVSARARSAQSALWHILQAFTRLMAPLGERVSPYWLQLPALFGPSRLAELSHFLDQVGGSYGVGQTLS